VSVGDTIFLVDENQPASWRRKSATSGPEQGEAMCGEGQDRPQLQEHSKAQKEENPLLNLILEIENQVRATTGFRHGTRGVLVIVPPVFCPSLLSS